MELKKLLFSFVGIVLFIPSFSQLTFKVQGVENNVIFARYRSGKAYSVDTLIAQSNGIYQYDVTPIEKGIYILLSGEKYVEFPVGSNQHFSMSVDFSADTVQRTLQFLGSQDNSIFQQYIFSKSAESMKAFALSNLPGIKDSFIRDYMMSLIPVVAPEEIIDNDTAKFYFYRAHYWDNVVLTSNQVLNSPLIAGKLNQYFNQMVSQDPDTVIPHMKKIIALPAADTVRISMLDFLLHYTFESKVMGMERAFVWLAENYFVDGKCDWLPDETLKTINQQYLYNRYCLIGQKGRNLKLITNEGVPFQLYDVESPYTLLLFYDISCHTCQDLVKEINDNYSKLFLNGVQVVALNTEQDRDKWIQFISDNETDDFINVTDPDNSSNFHLLYGIQSTPTLYLLDKDKNIIGKKLTVQQIFEIIDKKN